MNKKSKGEIIFTVFNYIFLLLFGLSTLYPMWSTFVLSISTVADSAKGGFNLYTSNPTLQAYKVLIKQSEIWHAYGITIMRTLIGTFLSVLVTAMYAYPLSRRNMPLKRFFSVYMIITMLFGGGMIPTYLVIKGLGLLDNFWVYILPMLMSAYNAVILRNYFASLPEAVIESALMDGASELTIFIKMIIPMSMPALATVALWNAVGHWNSWFDSMLYFNDTSKQVLQLYLQRMLNNNQIVDRVFEGQEILYSDNTMQAATIIVAVLPMLVIYPFIQKYFVKGITLGSVKG